MQQPKLTRVAVVGTSCSGKTTFARRLAGQLGTRCIELDALYWGPQWTPRTDFEQQVRLAVQESRWVVEGNYSSVRDMIWARSTAIVWLDYSFPRTFSQAFRRTVRRVVFVDPLYGGNHETIRGTLFDMDTPLWLTVRTYMRRRRELPKLFDRPKYRHIEVVRLRAPAEADTFLAGSLPVD
jgi:adenylate kinase family enzyme